MKKKKRNSRSDRNGHADRNNRSDRNRTGSGLPGQERLKLSLFTVYYPEEWKYDKERMQNMR